MRAIALGSLLLALTAAPALAEPVQEPSGLLFVQLAPLPLAGSVTPGPAFSVNRAYLTLKSRWMDGLASRVTLDASQGQWSNSWLLLKYAYADVAVPAGFGTLRLGRQLVPWIELEEDLWGYRVEGPVFADREKVSASAEWGASWSGESLLGDYRLGLYQGDGWGAMQGRCTFFSQSPVHVTALGSVGEKDYNSYGAMLTHPFTGGLLGLEGMFATPRKPELPLGFGGSAFGVLNLGGVDARLGLVDAIARLDTFSGSGGQNRAMLGLAYKPGPGVIMLLDQELTLPHTAGEVAGSALVSHAQLSF
jgi:hypothetical protein